MPNRILKESICYSDDLDLLTAFEETVFYRLLVRVDDYGRLDARPAFLRSQLFTTRTDITERQITDAINRLAEIGLICLYTVDEKHYLRIASWQKHQRMRVTKEKYPAPQNAASKKTGKALPQSAASCGELPQVAARACEESESESETETETETEVESGSRRFVPPTLTQVELYCRERKNAVSAERFVDYYESKGWLVGTSPMTNWQAAIRRWERGKSSTCMSARASPQYPYNPVSKAKNYDSEDCI